MSANSDYMDGSPVLPPIPSPQLGRALSIARRIDVRPRKNRRFERKILPPLALGNLPRRWDCRPPSEHKSGTHHFGSLEPLGTLGNFEPDLLTLIERTEAVSINRAVMDKDFLAVLHRNETVTFFGAEPLNNSGRHFPRQPPGKPNIHLNPPAVAPQARKAGHDQQARGAYTRFSDYLQGG